MLFAALDGASRGGEQGPRFLFPLLFLLLIGFLVSRVIRRRRGHHDHAFGGVSAMRTLQDRFANGDIDQAEFEHRKAVLDGADVIPPAPVRPAPPAESDSSESEASDSDDPTMP